MKFHSLRTACRCDFGLHVDWSGMPLGVGEGAS